MYAPTYSRLDEDRLTEEISSLDNRIAEVASAEAPETKRVLSYLKQFVRSRREKLATLLYQRRRDV